MFATKTLIITLALGATTLAQTEAQPSTGAAGQVGAGQAVADLDDEVAQAPSRLPGPEGFAERLLELDPGEKLTRSGVTVQNDPESSGPILLGPLTGETFESVEIRAGRKAAIHIDEGAGGLEYLQARVIGRAWLTVTGDQGLGHYDMREPYLTMAGIVVEGQGKSALPADEAATIEVHSSRNVIETQFGSRDHEIVLHGSENLVRMRGDDAVIAMTGPNRILSMWALMP